MILIEPLADHPEAIPVLKDWFEQEWAPYYGPEGPGDAGRELRESCKRDELPLTLVAFSDGELCGTATLKRESVTTHTHLTPWLAALLVAAGFRRRGIGEQLIAAVEDTARRLGFSCIYAGTGEGPDTPLRLLHKHGWRFIEKKPYYVSEISIFKKVF